MDDERAAGTHDRAARFEDTDWGQILTLYRLLLRLTDTPVVRLDHAVASAMVARAAGLEDAEARG